MVLSQILPSIGPKIITKTYKDFAKKLDFKDTKFSVELRDIQKIEKKNIGISVFYH